MLTYGNNVALKCSTSALRVTLVLTYVSNWLVDEKAKIKRDSENQSKRPLGGELPASRNWWFPRDVITAMFVDKKKQRSLICSFCSSIRNCTLHHCYLCLLRFVAKHLLKRRSSKLPTKKWDKNEVYKPFAHVTSFELRGRKNVLYTCLLLSKSGYQDHVCSSSKKLQAGD